jgi:hypothetical protein
MLEQLSPAGAAAGLASSASTARGFLGLDPVTQNEALLASQLTGVQARVFRASGALVGYMPNPWRPRQALVATTSAEPGPVRDLLDHLRTHCRASSYLAMVPANSGSLAAFGACGFTRVGVLREHRYSAGDYQDVLVYFAKAVDACRS